MKIRNGFVSNSSSSSFVLLIDKDYYDKTMKEQHPFLQSVGEQLGEVQQVFDREVMTFSGMDIQDYSWLEDTCFDYKGSRGELEEEGSSEVWDSFLDIFGLGWRSKVEQDRSKVVYLRQDG